MIKENKTSSLTQIRMKLVLEKAFYLRQQWKLWTAMQGGCGISFTRHEMQNYENYTNVAGVI